MKKIHKDIAKIFFDIIETTSVLKNEIAKNHSSPIKNMYNHKIISRNTDTKKQLISL